MLMPQTVRRFSYAYNGSEEPLIGETIGQMLERIVQTYPNNEALVYVPRDQRYTYSEFTTFAARQQRVFWHLVCAKGTG